MVDIEFIYNVSIHKLQNFQTTRRESDGLRKLVLLNNFVYEKFGSPEQDDDLSEWSEEDIKKDEESWLDSCLDELDEDDYVHVNVRPEHQSTVAPFPINHYDDSQHYEDHYVQDDNAMEYEHTHEQQVQSSKGDNAIDDVIIPRLPYIDPGDNFPMDIEEQEDNNINNDDDDLMNTFNSSSLQDDDVINMNKIEGSSENLTSEKGFHPYWKDNSIIAQSSSFTFRPCPYFNLNTHSFGIPKIFHKYRFDQYRFDQYIPHIVSNVSNDFEFLQPEYFCQSLEPPLRRSKDDLDILYPIPKLSNYLDRRTLMDVMSFIEDNGGKVIHNNTRKPSSSEFNNDIWFMDDNLHH